MADKGVLKHETNETNVKNSATETAEISGANEATISIETTESYSTIETINAKKKVVQAGLKLIESGLIARTWGNVSCRVDDSHFAITPSGRDYTTLSIDDIVIVRIQDLSYTGAVKPSGEKAVHAEIYKARPDIWFVIHTHQLNASVVSTLDVDAIDIDTEVGLAFKWLGDSIICADYGLPGTKKLRRSVGEALSKSNGHAIIMKNHGAVCFGVDDDAAFSTALELEKASIAFIEKRFLQIKPDALSEIEAMRRFISNYVTLDAEDATMNPEAFEFNSERTTSGFVIRDAHGNFSHVELGKTNQVMSEIMNIHREIYLNKPKVNYIVHAKSHYALAFSEIGGSLKPFVDDFAQIVGTKVKTVPARAQDIAYALTYSAAVFILGQGALCTGETEGDAHAVQIILEKNAKAKICGMVFDGNEPLSWIDTHLMRIVYQKKYAKQIDGGRL